ncbi:MAG: maltose alpha-D-glucosyltransferase, partial [Alphaproteobacteria bacterium]
MIDRKQTDWYRDAVIYQVHIKSFFDSNGDGIGDIRGLVRKLDYISDLGVNAIWIMPFYPSPLRDDGYDISDYRGINHTYGTMASFRTLIREAHKRDLRVITELVINHTSDQHPWFQRARKAVPGSPERDFYVWSDTDEKYADTRIIFLDTEASNWTYDPVAKAYYWHRFYSHQPDLNFDNPKVLEAVIELMFHWLDMGVDGLRLDAIPYLIERDGTSCENLPETHAVIKKIRAALDRRYPDRMLLAEANQWPEDTAPYFGDGDECHMAFHFPLMPRMYMSIAQEDRHPVSDILRQTPEIPEGNQWAIFLRNHDELTLEMVTDRERDYLWSFYAADRRARINLGIRRRLAPLLENDRRKIELMNSLLLTMPGTPILYYGDEIGMGDNIYLGDRDGVRTPMQWSPDRNGGFSRADPAQLFLPAIQDPIYGHQAVNVEAQQRSPSSLLSWTKRMLALRGGFRAFGRGSLRFLFPANRKVLSYLREFDGERILCVANISRSPQAVELDLAEHVGLTPVEMTGGEAFPPIGELPYLLTLPAYGFYWFTLAALPVEPDRLGPQVQPELFTLVRTGGLENLLTGREQAAFETTVAPRYLAAQRWFAGKTHRIARTHLDQLAILPPRSGKGEGFLLSEVAVELKSGQKQSYFIPMALSDSEEESLLPYALARVRQGSKTGLLFGASEE